MPNLDGIDPLAPDACRSDTCAPCYYLHLKRRALNGERDKLSPRELAFVGIYPPRPRNGWRSVNLPSEDGLSFDEPSEEEAAMWRSLSRVGQSRLEFLG